MEQGINSPLTSSCGRLFDAVAALAGIRRQVNYEAQAAIELEMAIGNSHDEGAYPFELLAEGEGWIIDTRGLFEALLHDIGRKGFRCRHQPPLPQWPGGSARPKSPAACANVRAWSAFV